jgi:hypothetical protein
MALRGDAAAVDRLIAIAKDGRDRRARSARKQATFWLSRRTRAR